MQQLTVAGGQQILEGRRHPSATRDASQLSQRLEPGGERRCRSGRITRQQRHRGTVGLIELVERARNQLERAGARGDPRPDNAAARNCGSSQRRRAPADMPRVANRATPSSSATACASAAIDASPNGAGVEPP
jgi:hypothetical protein